MVAKFNQLSKWFHGKFFIQPVEYDLDEVNEAWVKIDRILENAQLDTHVQTAQRMFDQMLHYFQFTEEQKRSPLIAGMQAKIMKKANCNSIFITAR